MLQGCEAANELELERTCSVNVSSVLPAPSPEVPVASWRKGLLFPGSPSFFGRVAEPFPALWVRPVRRGCVKRHTGDRYDDEGRVPDKSSRIFCSCTVRH